MSSHSTATGRGGVLGALAGFFGVVARKQTWLNLVYLLLAFPLGIAYFTALVTGFSVAAALVVVLVGVPLFVLVLYATRWLAVLERKLAAALLDVEFEPTGPSELSDGSINPVESVDQLVAWTKALLLDRWTWTAQVHLWSKFFVGIGTFVALVTLFSVTATLLATPLTYEHVRTGIVVGEPVVVTLELLFEQWGMETGLLVPIRLANWQVTTLADALAASAVGALLGLVSLHVCNGMARLLGWWATLLLPGPAASE